MYSLKTSKILLALARIYGKTHAPIGGEQKQEWRKKAKETWLWNLRARTEWRSRILMAKGSPVATWRANLTVPKPPSPSVLPIIYFPITTFASFVITYLLLALVLSNFSLVPIDPLLLLNSFPECESISKPNPLSLSLFLRRVERVSLRGGFGLRQRTGTGFLNFARIWFGGRESETRKILYCFLLFFFLGSYQIGVCLEKRSQGFRILGMRRNLSSN